MNKTSNKYVIFRGITFVFGVFLAAICYNVLLLPNNLVVGGMSGLSVVFQEMFGWNATIFIYVSSIILLILSYIFLGKEMTTNTAIGSLLYPLMISITKPMSEFILKYLVVDEFLITVCMAAILYGFAFGLIYKVDFSTGGGDVIMQLLSKYLKIPYAKANAAYSIIIVLLSGFTFGISSLIYAIIILVVSNIIIDKITVGISNSKVFYVYAEKLNEVKKAISDEYGSGFTILSTKSSFLKKNGEIIMVVIPNRDYFSFKTKILEIDPKAFFIITDCYEVNGGMRKSNIPFL